MRLRRVYITILKGKLLEKGAIMQDEQIKNELNQMLYIRMADEYEVFIERLKCMSIEDILRASYEKVLKEDILFIVENGELSIDDVRALLREQYPLEGCYQSLFDEEFSYMEDLKWNIENYAIKIENTGIRKV